MRSSTERAYCLSGVFDIMQENTLDVPTYCREQIECKEKN
jgi:hypothetical protein